MNEILMKRKKKKSKDENIKDFLEEILVNIRNAAKSFIGEENAVTTQQLFYIAYKKDMAAIPFYERWFYWNMVKSALKYLKSNDLIIVVNKGNKHFVLKTMQEYAYLENKINTNIDNLKIAKIKAKEWVLKKKWQRI